MNSKDWELQFWEDREKIRRDPSKRYQNSINETQLGFFEPSDKLFAACSAFESFERIKVEIYNSYEFCNFLRGIFFHFDQKKSSSLIKETYGTTKSVEHLTRLFYKAKKFIQTPLKEIKASNFPELKKFKTETRKILYLVLTNFIKKHSTNEIKCVSHTQRFRQQDGNLFLSKVPYFSESKSRPKIGLFVGGSIGLTAAQFYLTLPKKSQKNWKVINSDLFSPQYIWKSNKHKKGSKDFVFQPIPFLTYLQADMMKIPFAAESLDFIDACNCVGGENLNQVLDLTTDLWKKLKIGGYFRITTMGYPAYYSLFEELIVRKTGTTISDWDLVYINIVGRTVPNLTGDLEDPKNALKLGMEITKKVKLIQKLYFNEKENYRPKNGSDKSIDLVGALIRDIKCLSPIAFGSGVIDESALLFNQMTSWLHHNDGYDDLRIEENIQKIANTYTLRRSLLMDLLKLAVGPYGKSE